MESDLPKIEIYTKMWCGYCARAKALFTSKNVGFEEYDISLGGPLRQEMLARSHGGSTVPQIFINGQHIGGCDDLVALDTAGKLDLLLKV